MFGFKFRCLKQVTACVFLYFYCPVSKGVSRGASPKYVVNSSRPWGSDTCIYIQLPPGATTFNDHNTWIFKDAAQVMYVLENKPCRKKVIYNIKSGYA